MLPLSILVAALLFGSRWFSQIGLHPIYISEILLAGTFVNALVQHKRRFAPSLGIGTIRRAFFVPENLLAKLFLMSGGVLFLWLVALALRSDLTLNSLRDAAPFFYLLIASSFALIYVGEQSKPEKKSFTIFLVALVGHFSWVALGRLLGSNGVTVEIPNGLLLREESPRVLEFFTVRGDFDFSLIASIGSFLLLVGSVHEGGKHKLIQRIAAITTLSGCAALYFYSPAIPRAALVSAAFSLGLVAVLVLFGNHLWSRTASVIRLAIISAVIALPLLSLQAISETATLRLTDQFSGVALGVENYIDRENANENPDSAVLRWETTTARLNHWVALGKWFVSNPQVVVFGYPFGADYMADSNTKGHLVGFHLAGTPEYDRVRLPHNFIIGAFVRLGVFGGGAYLLFVTIPFILGIRALFGSSIKLSREEFFFMALSVLILSSIFLPSLFGVVLETPFGAIPYGWFSGYVVAKSMRGRFG